MKFVLNRILVYSIRAKILGIALLFIASMGITFVVYSMRTTVNYRRMRLESIEKTVQLETEKVNRVVSVMETGAVFYAISGKLAYEIQQENFGEKLPVEFLSSFPMAIGGGFWFEPYAFKKDKLREGTYAFYDKESGKIRLDDTFFMDEYDYHSKSWYREIAAVVKKPSQVAWTKPYTDDSGSLSLMTTAGSGVFDENGKMIALSTVDWEIDEVIKELTTIKPTKNSFVLLCSPEQDYVISSTRTNSVIGASIKSLPWNINADSFLFEGVNYMRFGRYMDNGWLLSIQIPETEIFAEVEKQNSRFSLLIAFSSIAMMGLAYYVISKYVNAPIKRLTTDVSRLALGNLDTQIQINSKDEFGLFAKTFNKMTFDLKKSIEESTRERTEKERIGAELNIAAAIQLSMLPGVFPPFPERTEFDIYASMIPAKEVGGDFYDFYFIDKDNLAVVIADVSGKGVPAALFMVITKTLIKNCSFCRSPKSVFESVNNKLCESNETDMFVTAFMGLYNIPSGKFTYVNAGHNPPLVKKHGSGCEFLETEPCFVLAWMKNTQYKEKEITLEPGDMLYLYTDGVTEAMNDKAELFGEQRLFAALNANSDSPLSELLFAIKREVDDFADGTEQADDITMLALKVSADNSVKADAHAHADNSAQRLRLQARVENLSSVIDFVNTELAKQNCSSDLQNMINVAVEEIFVNISNYAYKPGTGDVTLFVSCGDKAVIRFEDAGIAYNPLERAAPDFKTDILDREPGGLGIFLAKKMADSIEYSRVEDKNILIITKNLL